jgi:hypothetical protein
MTSLPAAPAEPISYRAYLQRAIAAPGAEITTPVLTPPAWTRWPGLNIYARLENRAAQAHADWEAQAG